jgi:DNA-binding MarR family transcriptional regulator
VDTDEATRLRRVIVRLARQFNAATTDEGLTPTQGSVLGLVVGRGPISLSALARIEGLNPTMLSRVVSKLDENGLIRRAADPADLRSAIVEVTPAGRRMSGRIKEQRAELVARCLDRLPAEQVGQLAASLPALEELADELAR